MNISNIEQKRNNMVELQLRARQISDSKVLKAMRAVPRHMFVPLKYKENAYDDTPLPIGYGQTISQPFTVAFQTQLLEINKGDKILEIGTGSGYQAAVLCEMGAKVFTIERIRELYRKTSAFLPSINYFPKKMIYGDGYQGYEKEEPFDGIIVTAGASKIPEKLLLQLKIGGRMVIPVGENTQKMVLYLKKSASEFDIENFGDFQFVPMLKNKI